MNKFVRSVGKRVGRTILLLLLVSLGTVALMRLAPGYYADAREMDAQYAQGARDELKAQQQQDSSISATMAAFLGSWVRGNLGQSRQYNVPVSQLIGPRLRITGVLLFRGVVGGWLAALALALPLSARPGRVGETLISAASACLLSIPVGAMATFCILSNTGGPALALGVLVGSRSYKFLYRMLRESWRAPHLLQARAQGISTLRITRTHLLPALQPQLLALFTMSVVVALGAVVPAEVIFEVPGVGQLAWSAAMNRDLPVLLAITLLMASAVACVGMVAEPATRAELA